MAQPQLPNYLRSNRKRLGLSQDEIAFLLGTDSGTKASRYEVFGRDPRLRTALAYEAIFQKPIRELFAGLYDEIEREVVDRAKQLACSPNYLKPGARAVRKREILGRIASPKSKKSKKP